MHRSVLLVLAACSHAPAPPPAPASNRVPTTPAPAETTHVLVRVFPLYDDCKAIHHIAVLLDDEVQLTVETHSECPAPPQHVNGKVIIVTEPHPYFTDSPRFDVPPGPHIIQLIDRENLHTGEAGEEFPAYAEDQGRRWLRDVVGVAARDGDLKMFGLTFDPGWRID